MRRVLGCCLAVLGFLLIALIAVYLWRMGLERADKVSSCIGAVAGLASLLLGVIQLLRSEPTSTQGTHSTTNTVGGYNLGQLTQADTIHGNIDMRRRD